MVALDGRAPCYANGNGGMGLIWRFGKERRSFKWRWVSWVWFFCFVFLLGVNFN